MQDFQTKRSARGGGRRRSRILLVILLLIVLWLSRAVWNIYQKNALTERNRERSIAEMQSLEERKGALEDKIRRLETQEGKEAEIRKNLSVVKEGERVIVVVEQASTSDEAAAKPSFWRRWFTFD